MTTEPAPKIAIIGSGPAGCYLAQCLLRAVPDAELVLFDRLVSPFGLLRYGVAADHQHTKVIARQFERLFAAGGARFAGGIDVGVDVSLAELRALFDVVVLATGLARDRTLGIPGAELPGVVGAGELTRILNAHPDEPERLPELGSDVVVIGAGNVAIDVLRFLVKDAEGYAGSDVADPPLQGYLVAPADRITLVSRSDVAAAKSDPQMLRELAKLERATYSTPDSGPDPRGTDPSAAGTADAAPTPASPEERAASARSAAIGELTSAERPRFPGPAVTLRYGYTPTRVLGDERVRGIELLASDGSAVTVPATAIITAIGFCADGRSGSELERIIAALPATPNGGKIDAGLYRVGWAQCGPRGGVPEHRALAKRVSEEILADLATERRGEGRERPGCAGLPEAVRSRAVSYEQWLVLEAHERETAPVGRVRRKIPHHDRMHEIATGAAPHPGHPHSPGEEDRQ